MMLVLSIFTLACGDKPADTGSDTSASDTTTEDLSFLGMNFILESSEGFTPVSSPIRLDFSEEQEMNFHAGCNGHGGSFSMDGDVLTVHSMYGTEIGCSQELMDQDMWLAEFFMSSPTLNHTGDHLIVTGSDATLTFIDENIAIPDQPLTNINWTVDTYTDGEIATAYNIDPLPTLVFEDDGSFTVETGCNGINGSFSTNGDVLSFSLEDITLIACENDIASIESHILLVFSEDASFSINGNRLSIEGTTKGISAFAEE